MTSEDQPVDLRSDTVTRPGSEMRRRMAEAPVADDVLGKDPTVRRLEAEVAERLGMDAALFFPSGTQANQAALNLHTSAGGELICEADNHVVHYEHSGAAWISGVQIHPVATDRGRRLLPAYRRALRPSDRHHAETQLVWVENTHNHHGGVAVPIDELRALYDWAQSHDLPVHLDGARLWNASRASGTDLEEYAACAETVMVSLSKGLGCPVGSLLAGPEPLIERAWTVRKRLGGGMRQVGILAAAGRYALDHHLERLDRDHELAGQLAAGCRALTGVRAPEPDTNIVMISLESPHPPAEVVARQCEERGVLVGPSGPRRLRAVTHRDVEADGVDRAVEVFRAVFEG